MRQFIRELFRPVEVNERIWNQFVDRGEVPKSIIRLLALKTAKREPLTEHEFAIFCAKTSEVNEMLIQISKIDI